LRDTITRFGKCAMPTRGQRRKGKDEGRIMNYESKTVHTAERTARPRHARPLHCPGRPISTRSSYSRPGSGFLVFLIQSSSFSLLFCLHCVLCPAISCLALLRQQPTGFVHQIVLESDGISLHRCALQAQPSCCPAPACHGGKDLTQDDLCRGPIDPKPSSNNQCPGNAGLLTLLCPRCSMQTSKLMCGRGECVAAAGARPS
jgi:hypothetical protein